MSMHADESKCKAKYLAMTIDQLRRQCEDAWLSAAGLKTDLIARLVDYEKPAGGWGSPSFPVRSWPWRRIFYAGFL